MSVQAAGTSVRASVEVDAPIERAFHLFTDDIGSSWDPEHHILRAELAEMVFEPRVGGYVYDRGVDGSECRWARVFAYEPPHRFVISWDISAQWQLETDLDKASEVEVRFLPGDRSARGSSSSTATWSATARAGRGCVTRWAPQADGRLACARSRSGSKRERAPHAS